VRAPRAAAYEFCELLNPSDLATALSHVGTTTAPSDLSDALTEKLNEALSDYLCRAESGTQDREGVLLRHEWFKEVAATASYLRQLLQPSEDAALLLSGVGQPMAFLASRSTPRMKLADWRLSVSAMVKTMQVLDAVATHGRETLAREIYQVRTEVSGWPTVLDTRRLGRPTDRGWAALAAELIAAWRHLTVREPTVTVDVTTDPPTRRSAAASFAAVLLDVAAERLPPEKSWAVDRLHGQEAKLVDYLEAQQTHRRFGRRKRRKSASE
jgi:hypothetical protein